jgi:hypothetical protein
MKTLSLRMTSDFWHGGGAWVCRVQTGGLRYLSGGGVAGAGTNFVLTVISR